MIDVAPIGRRATVLVRVLVALGLFAAVNAAVPAGWEHRLLVVAGVGVLVVLAWGVWAWRSRLSSPALAWVAVIVLVLGGAFLATWSPVGAVILGLGVACATALPGVVMTLVIATVGVAAATIAGWTFTGGFEAGLVAAVGGLTGLMIGFGRRERAVRARREAALEVAKDRAQVEHERAELLDERARIAREVHDVLAHTLSALVVQLNASAAIADDRASTRDEVSASLERSRRLAVEGLEEARQAVWALREDPVAVDARIADLLRDAGAEFTLTGPVRPLPAQIGHALIRITQEALTNVTKHAPDAEKSGTLEYTDAAVVLTIVNGPARATGPNLEMAGGGFGLTGMRERLALSGGTLQAGPYAAGWRVRAEVPL